jgi:hypothetical protein
VPSARNDPSSGDRRQRWQTAWYLPRSTRTSPPPRSSQRPRGRFVLPIFIRQGWPGTAMNHLPWNHQEPLCGTPFPQVAPDRGGRSYRFSFDEVTICALSRQRLIVPSMSQIQPSASLPVPSLAEHWSIGRPPSSIGVIWEGSRDIARPRHARLRHSSRVTQNLWLVCRPLSFLNCDTARF